MTQRRLRHAGIASGVAKPCMPALTAWLGLLMFNPCEGAPAGLNGESQKHSVFLMICI